jgi:hypothetical protein
MDEMLVRFLLDDLTADERAVVADRVAADPALVVRIARLRHVLDELSAEHEPPAPPPGLAVAAIARTAENLVAEGLFKPGDTAEWLHEQQPVPKALAGRAAAAWKRWAGIDPVFAGGRRADAAVAAVIGFLAVGVGLSAVGKLRHESQVRACQDNLRGLHAALSGYSDTHAGRFPQVGTPTIPVAGAFPAELVRAGQLWSPTAAVCPVAARVDPEVTPAEYSYSLGYRDEDGRLVGLRRKNAGGDATDGTPIAADPFGPAGPLHGAGQNVLYVGGMVRFAGSPAVGPNGDDIYRNDNGLTRAGLHRLDTSLGNSADIP